MLLQSLSGRIQNLDICGDIYIDGCKVDPKRIQNEISFLDYREDFLLGYLTPRETLTFISFLKSDKARNEINSDVEQILDAFNLMEVADILINPIFKRGLTDNQKKRIRVCTELVCPTPLLLMDEPTSGLDSSMSFEILSYIRDIVSSSRNKLSVFLSIQQPTHRITELFDNIILLHNGGLTYFGSVADACDYFSSIGYAPPSPYNVIDYFLEEISRGSFDFEGSFACCGMHTAIIRHLEYLEKTTAARPPPDTRLIRVASSTDVLDTGEHRQSSKMDIKASLKIIKYKFINSTGRRTSFVRQLFTLVNRSLLTAIRDVTLLLLQLLTVSGIGILIGISYYNLEYIIDDTIDYIGGVVFFMFCCGAFLIMLKVSHIRKAYRLNQHEIANKIVDFKVVRYAELVTGLILSLVFTTGPVIAHVMVGLPLQCLGFIFFNSWVVSKSTIYFSQ